MKKIIRTVYIFLFNQSIPNSFVPFSILSRLFLISRIFVEGILQIKRIFYIEPFTKSICKSVGDKVNIEKIPYINGFGDVIIGSRVHVSGKIGISFNRNLHNNPTLSIGDNTFIGHSCAFFIAKHISIGPNSFLANGVCLMDSDGHPLDYIERRNKKAVSPENVKPIQIGSDVWIGRDSIILKGVTIGDRAIIGAGSVVTKSIPADTIACGNPVVVVRKIDC